MIGRKLKVVCEGEVPAYAHEGDAGLDLRAAESGVHGVFDCEDAADDYAFQLSKEDGTRAYGALRCPKAGENL